MSEWSTAYIPEQTGKLAIVTGANSGIGFQTARALARAGCSVVLACRNGRKAEDARLAIVKETPAAKVEVGLLDLSSLESIHSFARAFLAGGRNLDILINNAGIMSLPTRKMTADGFEMQIGTNHLGHFALTGLLLSAVLAAPAARVVTVSSIAHKDGKIRLDDLNWEHDYKPWPAYRQSKLANLLFGLELQRRLERAHAKAISLIAHPGLSVTNILDNGPGATGGLRVKFVKLAFRVLAQSDEQGALPTLYAATATQARGGKYYGPSGFHEYRGAPTEVRPEEHARDPVLAAKLWTLSEGLTAVHYDALREPKAGSR